MEAAAVTGAAVMMTVVAVVTVAAEATIVAVAVSTGGDIWDVESVLWS
jgi:hypothetical protein